MWHRLALGLGMTVAEAQARVSVEEFRYWKAFYRLSPWDGRRLDYLVALICMVVGNLWRSGKSRRFTVEDFMPQWGTPERQDGSKMEAVFAAFAALQNRRTDKHGDHR